jgi:pseudouridine-5'-phosphate glycosidase
MAARKPVVALESTIVAHGMPFPQNLETAIEVENLIRSNGAVPATIAILDGWVKIGLSAEELERLARGGHTVRKVSRRDFSLAVADRALAATTVSGTMIAARMAGLSFFVTGGIGGVHRNASQSFDVSSDLTELGRTPIAVVFE